MVPPPGTSLLALGLGPEHLSCPHCPASRAAVSQGMSASLCSHWTVGTLRTVFSDFLGGSSMGWALRGASSLLNTGVWCVGWWCLNWTQSPTKEKTQAQRGGETCLRSLSKSEAEESL